MKIPVARYWKGSILSLCCIAAPLLISAPAAFAEDDVKCSEAGTQLEMTRCASDDFAAADKELNIAYHVKMHKLAKDEKTTLRNEQRAWLQKLRPGCKKAANDEAEGGSMWPMVFQGCMADETRKRTEVLKGN